MNMKNDLSPTKEAGDWGKELAKLWTNYSPPCRVSISELVIYTYYISKIKKRKKKRPKILILGSTTEFRDWAHEENLDVTIVDKSESYHKQISWELRHKNIVEKVVNCKWQEMEFIDEFDVVVGDLVVGNIDSSELSLLLSKVNNCLKDGGLFITKSFFANPNKKLKNIKEIFQDYNETKFLHHPYSSLIYEIAQNSLDWGSYNLIFKRMYEKIYKLYEDKEIDEQMMGVFENLGWQKNMKFSFYMPTFQEWEENISRTFSSFKKQFGSDVYSSDFPIYILTK